MDLIHVIVLLFIGFFVFTVDKRQKNFPAPMVLVLIGILLSFFSFFSNVTPSKELIHDWFLPAVLFTEAYRFNVNRLKKNRWLIAVISTVGLMASFLLLGSSIYLIEVTSLSFIGALVIASVLTPIDSVSVFSIQKETNEDKKVEEVVEGESLASDGASIVIFGTVSAIFLTNESFHIGSFISDFFYKASGGVLVGLTFGWLFTKALHLLSHHHYQVMLSLILAYTSFYTAEHFHMAGLLAVIAAGLTLSGRLNRSGRGQEYRTYLNGFWEVLEPALLSLIFLLIGIEMRRHFNWSDSGDVILIFALTLLFRFITIALITKIPSKWRGEFKWGELFLITVSGIKGTVSVALLLSLAASQVEYIEPILSLAFGTVVLSIVSQSLVIHPLSKRIMNR